MNGIEYVKLSNSEIVYGKKNVLNAQVEMLNLVKSCDKYRSLRKEEIALKILLKSKIEEVKNSLNVLSSILPKVKNSSFNITDKKEKVSKKNLSLEQEIEQIKKKLAALK